jgi:hypothetical protein
MDFLIRLLLERLLDLNLTFLNGTPRAQTTRTKNSTIMTSSELPGRIYVLPEEMLRLILELE